MQPQPLALAQWLALGAYSRPARPKQPIAAAESQVEGGAANELEPAARFKLPGQRGPQLPQTAVALTVVAGRIQPPIKSFQAGREATPAPGPPRPPRTPDPCGGRPRPHQAAGKPAANQPSLSPRPAAFPQSWPQSPGIWGRASRQPEPLVWPRPPYGAAPAAAHLPAGPAAPGTGASANGTVTGGNGSNPSANAVGALAATAAVLARPGAFVAGFTGCAARCPAGK